MFEPLKHWIGGKTDFSLSQSIIDPKTLVQEVAGYSAYTALTVTDTNSVNALPKIYGVDDTLKINFGATIHVCDDLTWRKPKKGEKKSKNAFFQARLIARNAKGVSDIMRLLSLANDPDHFYVQAQVSIQELIACVKLGNVVLSTGDLHSLFALRDFQKRLKLLVSALGRSILRFELVPVSTAYFDRINELAIKASAALSVPLIITRPILYKDTYQKARDVVACTLLRSKVNEMWRQEPQVHNLHPLSQDQMNEELERLQVRMALRGIDSSLVARKITDAITETNRLPEELDYTFKPLDISLPKMTDEPFKELVRIASEGWKERITKPVFGYMPDASTLPVYRDRLKYELEVLRKMGFERYFLLVHKVVNHSRNQGVMVGPGRGSVGGSLIAFLMGITDVDPIRFGLIFERFINPERLDLPDADLDFMSSRRTEIVDWLISEFGQDYVCCISNYGVLGASSALRRISSAYGLSEKDYECSKLVPKEHGNSVSLEEAAESVASIQAFAKQFPEVWDVACRSQGVFNIYGQHAAGVVVAGDKISNRAVVETRAGGSVCNWDKDVVEKFGLVKLDILGLSNLDVLRLAKEYIEERHGIVVDYEDVALDDPDVLKAFGEGRTNAVFQFESGGMKQLLKNLAELQPLTFDDLSAATALYRPGPMDAGLMDQYVDVKSGNTTEEYPHELTKPALKETYGVMVYQEQVMQIARDLAGFSMAEADKLRKAIGKKDPVLMASMRDKFVEGAKESGMSDYHALGLFDQIEKFAGYSFNKSHSVAYTLISYLSMWLKVKYPAEFFAASMSILKEEKLPGLVRDAQLSKITVLPPDINLSTDRFEIIDHPQYGQCLVVPFQRVKGLSEKSCAAILEARERRKQEKGSPDFVTKSDFLSYVDKRRCNVRVQNTLDEIGAFADIEGDTPAMHPDRLKIQKQMIPGLISQDVKADRKVDMSPFVRSELQRVLTEAKTACEDFPEEIIVMPAAPAKKAPLMMVVTDAPNWTERDAGLMGCGKACESTLSAMKEAGLMPSDAYITSLSKMAKPQSYDSLPLAMISAFAPILDEEIRLVKPPVIVALGSKVARHLLPDLKGGWAEIAGTSHYDPKRDCTIIIGCNPSMLHFDPSKINILVDAFNQARELVE